MKSIIPAPTNIPKWITTYRYTSDNGELLAYYHKDENGVWQDELPKLTYLDRLKKAEARLAKLKIRLQELEKQL